MKHSLNKKFKFDFEIFENFKDMCFILSGEGEILNLNKSVYNEFKIDSKNLLNQSFFDMIVPSYAGAAKAAFLRCTENKSNENLITKFQIEDKFYDISLNFMPYSDPNPKSNINNCFILARDITKQRLKEIELMRFYYVAQNTVNPVQITDLQGNMIYVNPAFIETSGYSREDLIGKNPNIFSSGKHSKKFWYKMWSEINEGKVWVGEVENKRKNGDPFYTQLLISPILDNDGSVTGFFGIHRDLSEKKLLEKQLIHTQKMESIGTLAAGVAHEVGNPLASISALVQVVQRSTNDEFAKEKLELIKKQVTRISKIIRDLVDFSRPSNYELQLTDINQNIVEAIEITKVGAKAKDISFILDLNKQIPLLPLISDQIQQIFVNVLLNAVDAIEELGISTQQKKIEITSDLSDENVLITFKDSGKGIPENNLVKVFEPFFTTKQAGKGTGLGLWVSYGIIKSFQGDIKVESKPGKSTTFTITLPIHP